jgi:structural maintenance of chromosome 2
MFIQEIILDGFKSYATRTVVSGFDPMFNAITGLNGSGKSNILDSICFVLGISNLQQVRVGNLSELVYKQGQAGVTKATVTIVFNNSDPTTAPVGYETDKQITVTRQIVIGGKNKYMINGRTVQQSQVQNLFHSVQLNVNNPHFLIMQGRITKVLNMKPEETLGMIEEAAGTRMYETKKMAAQKTIEKKQLKVQELQKCLDEDITPTLEKLRDERKGFTTWQANNVELERLGRMCAAIDYKEAETKLAQSKADKENMTSKLAELGTLQQEKKAEIKKSEKGIEKLKEEHERGVEGEMRALKAHEVDTSKNLVRATATLNNHQESFKKEREAANALASQAKGTSSSAAKKKSELEKVSADVAAKEELSDAAEQASAAAKEKYQNAIAGVADESNSDLLSLPEQVGAWEKRAREAQSQQQQGDLRAKHAAAALKDLEKQAKGQANSNSSDIKEAETLKKEVAALEKTLGGLGGDVTKEDAVKAEVAALKKSASRLKDTMEELNGQLAARLRFDYRDPEKGFDRSRVKGMVASLVRVADPEHTTALEVAAGGKLYQVVVDSEVTGKALLQKGQLKKRVTILPLNKIDARTVSAARVDAAKAIAKKVGGKAALALELVQFEPDVAKAMQHVFGSVIVCDSPEVAKAVAFDKDVRVKTITLAGDVYDPSGTMSGGSSSNLGVILKSAHKLAVTEEAYKKESAMLKERSASLQKLAAAAADAEKCASKLELKQHALAMVQEKIGQSSYAQTQNEIDECKAELTKCEEEKKSLKEAFDKAQSELKRLEKMSSNLKKERENAMKRVENEMKSAQKAANDAKKAFTSLKGKKDALTQEISILEKEGSALEEQAAQAAQALAQMTSESEVFEEELSEAKKAQAAAEEAVADMQAKLDATSGEIDELNAAIKAAAGAVHDAEVESRELNARLKSWKENNTACEKAIKYLLEKHPWIRQEREHFGVEGGDFDFGSMDVAACQSRLSELKADQDRIAKKINKKVMGMIEKAEKEYTDLTKKRDVIQKDKDTIEDVIRELDIKKMQALQSTWVKVNRDFGSIFSMLLPGTHAKLDPPEGKTVTEGLEVKVAFNNVWKESLTELSGGQRSLLALSLILALLLFKPAPMYILDEVDAALDLSHTQNIGTMLKTHFSGSQFIVVSLKEGMFNNANVIFRTRFIDGVSCVIRTVGKGNKGGAAPLAITDAEEEKKRAKASKAKGGKAATKENATANLVK